MKLKDVEEARVELTSSLSAPGSEKRKLRMLLHFFQETVSGFDFSILRSYYLEFSKFLLSLERRALLLGCSPEQGQILDALLSIYETRLADCFSAGIFSAYRQTLRKQRIELFLVMRETDRLFPLLQESTGENFSLANRKKILSQTRLLSDFVESASAFAEAIRPERPDSWKIIHEIILDWKVRFRPKPDQLFLLLVEKDTTDKSDEDCGLLAGMYLSVYSQVRGHERWVRLNNETVARTNHPHSGFHHAIDAVMNWLKRNHFGSAAGQDYSLIYSVSESNARYTGDSWNTAIALLTGWTLVNTHYRQSLALLDQTAAITGSMDAKGKIIPVDRQGMRTKIKTAFYSPIKRVVVPRENLAEAAAALVKLNRVWPNRILALESAENLDQLMSNRNLVLVKRFGVLRRILSKIRIYHKIIELLLIICIFIILIWMGIFKQEFFKDPNPAEYSIRGQILVVTNAEGEILWKYHLGVELDPRYYNKNYQRTVFVNADQDSHCELLFGIYDMQHPELSGRLIFFDHDGSVIFNKKTGCPTLFGGSKYDDHYRIQFLDAIDLDGNGEMVFLTISVHWPYFPCCVNIWDKEGNKLGEYWHSGHLERLDCYDVDGDGVKEIFATGQNNEYHCAVLAVLRPFNMNGASPQARKGNYYANDRPRAKELAYIRFPQSAFYKATQKRDITYHTDMESGLVRVAFANPWIIGTANGKLDAGHMLYYYFDSKFILKSVSIADGYVQALTKLRKEVGLGFDTMPLDKVLYFDKTRWVEKPNP